MGSRVVSGRFCCSMILTFTPGVALDSSHTVKGKFGFCQWVRKFLLPPALLPLSHAP